MTLEKCLKIFRQFYYKSQQKNQEIQTNQHNQIRDTKSQ